MCSRLCHRVMQSYGAFCRASSSDYLKPPGARQARRDLRPGDPPAACLRFKQQTAVAATDVEQRAARARCSDLGDHAGAPPGAPLHYQRMAGYSR